MDGAITEFVKVLTGLGLPGVIIAALLWFSNKQNKRIDELTDKIIAISAEQAKVAESTSGALVALKDVLLRGGKVAE
jgi:Tfp pilus assembly protein PilN